MDPWRSDSHIHTIYSGHAKPSMTIEGIIGEVKSRNLVRAAITEHVFSTKDLQVVTRVRDEVQSANGRITVGAEIDANPIKLDGSLVAPSEGIDWVIASIHHFPGTSIWWFDKDFHTFGEEEHFYQLWIEWVHRIISISRPDVLGHPGVLICQLAQTTSFTADILNDLYDIFCECRKYGVAVELNELAFHKMTALQRETYYKVFAAAREAKAKIAIGSDAHASWQIGNYIWVKSVCQKLCLKDEDCMFPGGPL